MSLLPSALPWDVSRHVCPHATASTQPDASSSPARPVDRVMAACRSLQSLLALPVLVTPVPDPMKPARSLSSGFGPEPTLTETMPGVAHPFAPATFSETQPPLRTQTQTQTQTQTTSFVDIPTVAYPVHTPYQPSLLAGLSFTAAANPSSVSGRRRSANSPAPRNRIHKRTSRRDPSRTAASPSGLSPAPPFSPESLLSPFGRYLLTVPSPSLESCPQTPRARRRAPRILPLGLSEADFHDLYDQEQPVEEEEQDLDDDVREDAREGLGHHAQPGGPDHDGGDGDALPDVPRTLLDAVAEDMDQCIDWMTTRKMVSDAAVEGELDVPMTCDTRMAGADSDADADADAETDWMYEYLSDSGYSSAEDGEDGATVKDARLTSICVDQHCVDRHLR